MLERLGLMSLMAVFLGFTNVHAEAGPGSAIPPKTGSFTETFAERHPESEWETMVKRWKWSGEKLASKEKGKYQINDESFRVIVPRDYTGNEPYGLLVWINSGDGGGPPGGWEAVLAKHKIIWIGANQSGNNRNSTARFGLALDAVHNMDQRYCIDSRRIYVSGFSGGGRCASMVGIIYPDVFRGAFYNMGCNFYKKLDTGNNRFWEGFWDNYDQKIIAQARQVRLVFMTASKDFNRDQTKRIYEASLQDGFRRSLYLEVPEGGHATPPPDWFEKGIVFLDSYLKWMVPEGRPILNGVPLKHFTPLENRLVIGKPLKPALAPVTIAAKANNEKGDEAKAILSAVDNWTVAELKRLQEMQEKQPVAALEELERYLKTVRGLPTATEAEKAIAALKKEKGVLELARIRAGIGDYLKKLDHKGPSRATEATKEKILKALAKLEAATESAALIAEIKETAAGL
ncbi:MAG: hypothetical protein RBS99_16355 [Rhodospirillales bacterium]|nr:hypothetical protein [Rhodospirillales bacterium]